MADIEDIEDTTIGGVTWHSSEEDGGPDVGISVYLGDHDRLWAGEVSRELFTNAGGADHFDSDGGWFLVRFKGESQKLIAKFGNGVEAQEFIEQVSLWVRADAPQACRCGPTCEDKHRPGCRYFDVTPTRVALRALVDAVWQHATESTAVPSTDAADRLITKTIIPSQDAAPVPQSAASTVEPVAWRIIPEDTLFLMGSCVTDEKDVADIWRKGGNRVEPLYAAPTTSQEPDAVREAKAMLDECWEPTPDQVVTVLLEVTSGALRDALTYSRWKDGIDITCSTYAAEKLAQRFGVLAVEELTKRLAALSRPAHGAPIGRDAGIAAALADIEEEDDFSVGVERILLPLPRPVRPAHGGWERVLQKIASTDWNEIEWARQLAASALARKECADPPPQKTIRELYPNALCRECEWEGPRENLKSGFGAMDELCPQCGSGDTEWVPAITGKDG